MSVFAPGLEWVVSGLQPVTLAQSSALGRVLPWIVGLMLFVVAAGVALMMVRKQILGAAAEDDTPPLMISDLRQFHKEGKLSDEEFELAKGALVAGVRAKATSEPPIVRERPPESRQPPPPGDEGRVAPPGVDLTGEPLPGHDFPNDSAS